MPHAPDIDFDGLPDKNPVETPPEATIPPASPVEVPPSEPVTAPEEGVIDFSGLPDQEEPEVVLGVSAEPPGGARAGLPKLWDDLLSTFKDPGMESAKATQALVDAEALGITPSTALRLQDTIDRGVKFNARAAMRRSDVTERVNQQWDIGKTQNAMALKAGSFVETGDPAWLEEARKLRDKLPGPEDTFVPESRTEEAVSAAAKMLPLMLDSAVDAGWVATTIGAGFGVITLVAGQPELTVPAVLSGLTIGGAAGMFEASMKREAGLAALEMSDIIGTGPEGEEIGLDPNVVRATAGAYGVVAGLLEVGAVKVLMESFPGGKKLLRDAMATAINNPAVRSKIVQVAANFGGTVTKETGIELLQESTNILATEIAKELDPNDFPGTTIDEIATRLIETAAESAKAFAVISAPGPFLQGVGATREAIRERFAARTPEDIDVQKQQDVEQAEQLFTRMGLDPETVKVESEKIAERAEELRQTFLQEDIEAEIDPGVVITDNVTEQLVATGRFDEQTARTQASLFGAFFQTMGERAGIDPLELYNQYGFQVERAQEAPAEVVFGSGFKPETHSLSDFVRTEGGISAAKEPLTGEVQDAFSIKEGGGGLVNNETGQSFETLVESAVEQGFFAETPTVAEFITTLEEDLVAKGGGPGTRLFSAQRQGFEDEGFLAAEREHFEREAERLGITFDRVTYDQAGRIVTETPEFEAYFGESQVVDEQGEPLVVYHGTAEDFEAFEASAPEVFGGRRDFKGVYFTPDREMAHSFGRRKAGSLQGRRIVSAYLKIERPLNITKPIADFQAEGMTFGDAKRKAIESFDPQKHDGIIFDGDNLNTPEYVTVSPEQVKSVFNRGTFDPTSPNILEQSAVGGQSVREQFIARTVAAQDFIEEARSVGRRPKLNVGDGTITLFHGTSADAATIIRQEGLAEQSFLALSKGDVSGHIQQIKGKKEIIEMRVDARDVEFSTGTQEVFAPKGLTLDTNTGIWSSAPLILEQAAPLAESFFSQLQRVVSGPKFPTKAPGDVMMNVIRKGAVKAEEIKWSFVEEFLEGKKVVTKDELLEYLQANEVEIEVIEKSSEEHGDTDPDTISEEEFEAGWSSFEAPEVDGVDDHALTFQRENVEEAEAVNRDDYTDEDGEFDEDAYNSAVEELAYDWALDNAYQSAAERPESSFNHVLNFTIIDETALGNGYFVRNDDNQQTVGQFGFEEDARQAVKDELAEEGFPVVSEEEVEEGNTRHASYQLPGGQEYVEMLLTLPTIPSRQALVKEEVLTELPEGFEVAIDRSQPEAFRFSVIPPGQVHGQPFSGRNRSSAAAIRDALEVLNFKRRVAAAERLPGEFTFPFHFDEPNIVAHVRFNTREDVEGSKVLFIEELQSDWAREGRQKGFKAVAPEAIQNLFDNATREFNEFRDTLVEKYDETLSPLTSVRLHGTVGDFIDIATPEEIEEFRELQSERDRFGREVDIQRTGVPAAPLLKNWEEFALKRMLRYAAENGFDKVAWITGEQTAERYNLARYIDRIEYTRRTDGAFDVTTFAKEGGIVTAASGDFDHSKLESTFGVELTAKMEAGEGRPSLPTLAKAIVDQKVALENARLDAIGDAELLTDLDQTAPTREAIDARFDEASKRIDGAEQAIKILRAVREKEGVSQDDIATARSRARKAIRKIDIGAGGFPELIRFTQEGEAFEPDVKATLRDDNLKLGGEWALNLYDQKTPNIMRKLGKKFGARVGDAVLDANLVPTYTVRQGLDSGLWRVEKDKVLIQTWPPTEAGQQQAIAQAESLNKIQAQRGESRQKTRVGIQQSLPITSELKEAALEEGFALFQRKGRGKDPRGRITFESGRTLVELFQKADLSTFLHEAGHFYLNVMNDLAQREGASEDVKADFQTVLEWFGVESWDQVTHEHHEQWARGFEAFLREGKAPSSALRAAFDQFKGWLRGVYLSVRQLKVSITPEVREVLERILATDEDIELLQAEVDQAVIDLVTEGRVLEEIKAADITSVIPTREVKGIVRESTGLKRSYKTIREDQALNAAWKKAEQSARIAFKAGQEAEAAKWKKKMADIVRKANRKIAAVKTEKEKMAARRRRVRTIRDYLGLTDAQLKKATGRKNFLLLDDYQFKLFIDRMLVRSVELQQQTLAKARVSEVINRKALEKTDNYRKALDMPPVSQMSTAQLNQFADALDEFHEGDVFLTTRELETVDRTDLAGIRTWREAKIALAKELDVKVEDLDTIPVSWTDNFKFDSALAETNPFYNMMVVETNRKLLEAEGRVHEVEEKLFDLARKSEKSRGRSLKARLVPQDEQVFDYLEAPADEKEAVAKDMTPEQVDLADFMQQYFSGALEYLLKVGALEKGRENYFTHMRRTFLETLLDDGLITAILTVFKNYEQDQMVFNILDEATGDILPLEKFFQYSLRRTGTLTPTKNVVRAFLTYARTFEKKVALDELIPKLDIYAQSLTPRNLTPRGLEMDTSLKRFVNKYINNKKGRQINMGWFSQGSPPDVAIRGLRAFVSIMDLGLNIPVGVAAFVGEQTATFEMLGARGIVLGTRRMKTKKGKAILADNVAFTGRSTWEEFTVPGKEVTDRVFEGLFGLFHASTVLANKQFLLASLTKEEYDSGKVSDARLAEIQREMGRFRVVPGTASLAGSTGAGRVFTQYKTWAIPIARTLSKDIGTTLSNLKNKPVGEALTTREAREIYRFIGLTLTVLIVLGAADDNDDRSFIGQLERKVKREALTLMQGMSPKLWLSVPRMITFLAKLGDNLTALVTMEEFKTKPGLKGAAGLEKQFTPAVIRSITNDRPEERRR